MRHSVLPERGHAERPSRRMFYWMVCRGVTGAAYARTDTPVPCAPPPKTASTRQPSPPHRRGLQARLGRDVQTSTGHRGWAARQGRWQPHDRARPGRGPPQGRSLGDRAVGTPKGMAAGTRDGGRGGPPSTTPPIRSSSSMTSAALVTSAPCQFLMMRWPPADRSEVIGPGTAISGGRDLARAWRCSSPRCARPPPPRRSRSRARRSPGCGEEPQPADVPAGRPFADDHPWPATASSSSVWAVG